MVLILVPVFIYNRETPFPGLAALPPCLGVALLIWTTGLASTVVGSFLSARPVVFIGLISYSFYLWHWPLLAFSKYSSLAPLSLGHRITIVGFGFLLAIFSWKYVETPFRKRKLGTSRKTLFTSAGLGLATILGCGLLCMIMQGFPQRFPGQVQEFINASSDMAFIYELTNEDIRSGKLIPIGKLDSTMHPIVLVWGDSHAMSVLPAVDAFLKEKGLTGRAVTHSSTAPILDWFMFSKFGLNQDAIDFNDSVFSYIQSQHIPHVILIARWGGYIGGDGVNFDSFKSSLLETVRRLVAIGSRPWIMLEVPNYPFNIPRALSSPNYFHKDIISLYTKPTALNELEVKDPKIVAEIEAAGGRILDPKPRFLDPTGQHYVIQANGIALYRDEQHLTTKGAKLMLLPLLRDSLILEE